MIYDYLIIGQGLAGSILAYELSKRNKSIVIVDELKPNTSSTVAAGLVNPLTGPNMVKSWKVEMLYPHLVDFYKGLEEVTGVNFFSERTIYRPYSSAEEINDMDGRSAHPGYLKFIVQDGGERKHSNFIYDPYGGIELKGAVLNVLLFIQTMRQYLSSKHVIINDRVGEDQLDISEHFVCAKGIRASKVIFCTGYQVCGSRLFGWIPFAPVKGEILFLKLNEDFETIYNKSCFIIPQGNGLYKAGSTYERNDLSETPSDAGKNEITGKLDALLKMKYEIVKHEAGIRPGTVPRRPMIGMHPRFKNVGIFNGLGTKGVSLAPYFSDQFVKCLEDGNNLDLEVDIKKYYSLYFNSHFSERI